MTGVAAGAGVKREALYRALSAKGNPEFRTVLQVMAALGLQLAPVKIADVKKPAVG
jgi:probable addiction module antidote protein